MHTTSRQAVLETLGAKRGYTVPEACKYLRLGVTTVYELIATGQLRTFKIGRARRVTRDALDEFIANREREASVGKRHARAAR